MHTYQPFLLAALKFIPTSNTGHESEQEMEEYEEYDNEQEKGDRLIMCTGR